MATMEQIQAYIPRVRNGVALIEAQRRDPRQRMIPAMWLRNVRVTDLRFDSYSTTRHIIPMITGNESSLTRWRNKFGMTPHRPEDRRRALRHGFDVEGWRQSTGSWTSLTEAWRIVIAELKGEQYIPQTY